MQYSHSKGGAAAAPRTPRQVPDLQEHRLLRQEYARDWSARLLVQADAAIRRAAHRISGWFGRA